MSNMWKLNNVLLSNKNKSQRKLENAFTYMKKETKHTEIKDTMKEVTGGQFVAVNTLIRKKKKKKDFE